MTNIIEDGGWTSAQTDRASKLSAPIPAINSDYVLEQDYVCNRDNFSPLALNTAHPDLPTYKLVSESPLQDVGCGAVKWTRTYAQVPASWSEPAGNIAYTFIGQLPYQFVFTPSSISKSGRLPYSKVVPVRLQRDYFLVGTGGSYATAELIPLIAEQTYKQLDLISGLPIVSDFVFDSPPYALASIPTLTAYLALVGSEIVTQASNVTRWMGNIFCRETRYIIAE